MDAETWQACCDLQFSQFPLHFVKDANETAAAITVAAAGPMAAEVEQAAAHKEAAKLAQQKASIKCAEDKDDAAVDKAAETDNDGIGTDDNDDGLWSYIRETENENPLHLSSDDLQSIHRRFELYTEYFPPGANGPHRFLVDTDTWRTYCDLQFSQFPLHFVDDERKLLAPEA